MEMGSRRTMNRSLSGNGRSLNGTEVRGSSRPPGCSYLSNVRPENRSTLCSVIAQLTEETQPFFEVTLKSRAVSESCNVKFTCVITGYPAPQITWYKDDIQLDRYCGLPKYEIFRNGQNHSLHIYNCTEEDAAIYQASAINTKGIVSCSGVLEVGEMNEFKIHQRYFSKLKQKAESKRKEAEEKENQEPVRTISPDRAQRKRRSTVGGYISAPSSTEEDTSKENQQEAATDVKARVQENSVEEVKDTNGTMESIESHLINGQDAKENTPLPGTHMNDSAQTAKTPFVKKLKISSTAKSNPEETKACEKEKKLSLAGSELPESPKKSKHLMDSMEVESSPTSASVLPSFKFLKRRVTSIGSKQGLSQEKVERKTTKGNVKVQSGSPSNNPSPVVPPRASKLQLPQPTIKQDNSTTPKVMDRDKKAQGLSPDMTPHTDTSCDSETALPQPPCQQVRQDPPQREIRPDQKRGRMPAPVQKREATQAQAKTQRNDAPVDLELKPKLHTTVAAETPPSEWTERDRRGPSLHSGLHKAVDNMSQDTQDHSKGSGEICVGLLADTQRPPLESSSVAENKSKCNVPPTVQQSQPNMQIKTVEGIKIQLHEKVKGKETNMIISLSTSGSQSEEGEMNPEEKARNIDEMTADLSQEVKECKSSVDSLQASSRGHSPLQPEENTQITNKTDMFLESEPKDLKKCPSPIPNIISIAELLRSQINALEESVSSRIASIDNKDNPIGGGVGSESNAAKINKDTLIDKGPPQTIKETLMQIYNELIKTKELFVDESPVLSNCTQPLESIEIPSSVTPEKTIYSEINEHKANNHLSETGLNLKDRGEEPLNEESMHDTDTQALTELTPEIKLDCIPVVQVREMLPAPLTCNSQVDEPKSHISSLEHVQELPVPSVLDSADTLQKNSPSIPTEDTETAVILPHLISDISPMLEKKDCDSIPSATPQELASGARRKIPTHKTKLEEMEPPIINNDFNPVSVSTSPRLSRHSTLLQPNVEPASPKKKRSPLLSRKKSPVEIQSPQTHELPDVKSEENPANKTKNDPYRAPQVIRKIRGETFADHSGNMKLWCQFFNVLSESTVTWYRDELEVAKILKSAGDETQVSLALAQATSLDTGVYGCTITNEYGTDSTDFLLSAEVLGGMSLQEDLGVGEEIELTPLMFNKGVADSCVWGNKLFGRIMVQESRLGGGFSHKTWRAKVIYGLEPVFESGNSCIIKVCSPIVYGGKGEAQLIEKNQEGVKQACKIQNLVREYCKIFSTEARAIESFGSSLEVIPVYLMYRPANSIPYATVETDLKGVYSKYCGLDHTGRLDMRSGSEVEQKCSALLHWIFQWTSGNMLFTKLEGVDFKITNVGISVKSHGHQGLPLEGNPKVFEQFVIQHQCNYFCGLLGLRSLKVIESLLMPTKPKGSKSPLVQRKMGTGSSSPQTGRKTPASPRIPKKIQ